MNNNPIGVFDSGIGGLTVVKEIVKVLPGESIIYLGDTARVPYGTRSKEVVTKFAKELVVFLLKRKVKTLVVACNTISSVALDEVKKLSPVPVLGVVIPAATVASHITRKKKVGVIGTAGTISSCSYEKEIKNLDSDIEVVSVACPLFVPLAEEGFGESEATKIVAQQYLKEIKSLGMDTLILGCTHYPVLKKIIQSVVGKKVELIDSAKPTAKRLREILEKQNLLNGEKKVTYEFFVTDAPDRVFQVANRFFGSDLRIKKVTL